MDRWARRRRDTWPTSAILLALIGLGAFVLLKGRLPLRPADCDELRGAIKTALRIAH